MALKDHIIRRQLRQARQNITTLLRECADKQLSAGPLS